jgi:GT2 family glycosyltransferase
MAKNMDDLTKTIVIVVNFNGKKVLGHCLESLKNQTFHNFKTIVVDNSSHDGSIDEIKENFPKVEVIKLKENIGFSAANNYAIKQSKDFEWVALLNPDAIADPNWLLNLHDAAYKNPEYSFFGSHLRKQDSLNHLDGTGDIYHLSGLAWRRDHGIPESEISRSVGEIFSPCAAAAMYRRNIFLEVGGFDERFFCYFEDVDLAFRLNLAGHRCLYVPNAKVKHLGSAITGRRSDFAVYHGHRNMVWAYFKNMPSLFLWYGLPQHILANVSALIFFSLNGQAGPILKAKRDALLGLRETLNQRKLIQKNKKASSEKLKKLITTGWLLPYFKKNKII